MTRKETATVTTMIEGTTEFIAKLKFRSGLPISEAIHLRVQDIDMEIKGISACYGKGE
jgi:hypothetical protein